MYRVFRESVGWSDGLFIIDSRISFTQVQNNPQTSMLNKNNYIGEFDFDIKFLDIFDNKEISGHKYYYSYSHERDKDKKQYEKPVQKIIDDEFGDIDSLFG